ncbi:arsenate reductase ArsC [Hyphococcus sp.]|uniref:arsenate reductase ArsC n=1 Tax=Hyphococcus sp. TaxID=2038636 RepID=UPI00208693AA|nr:MAG: ArsR family transcriptional regulator [Marinicaulis sp.]
MKNILFLCTGNSARSIMAEAYMNHTGAGRWRAYSAGSTPTGKINPFALETLAAHGVTAPDSLYRSKSWDEFAAPGAPIMDVVITVCDNAAGETCPIWPARNDKSPQKLHWSFPDPAAVEGDDAQKRVAFEKVFADIRALIDAFLAQSA